MRQDARTTWLVTQLQTRTPTSTFYWTIHRWRSSSPFSCLSRTHRACLAFDPGFGRWICVVYQGAILGVWVRAFDGGRRKYFEVDAIMRTRGRFLWPTAGSYKHSIISFRFPRFICLCSLSWPIPFRRFISPRHHLLDMRRDVQEIFRATPHHKQVMMFSATLAKEIRVTCKKFMANVCDLTPCHSLF